MVKEFFVVGSDDHSNDNPKIGNTDLRHVSLFLLLLLFLSCSCVSFFLPSENPLFFVRTGFCGGRPLKSVIRKWTSKNGRAC
jgi:hypothetical protein